MDASPEPQQKGGTLVLVRRQPPVSQGLLETLKARMKQSCTCSMPCVQALVKNLFPVIYWLRQYRPKEYLAGDVMSGLVIGIILVPQAIAYSLLAGLQPIYSLYTSFFANLIYFLMGTSRHVNVGIFSLLCLMVGQVVDRELQLAGFDPSQDSLGPKDNDSTLNNSTTTLVFGLQDCGRDCHAIRIATALTLVTGLYQVLMGVLRLGFVSTYLSQPLLDGFAMGASVTILTSQVKHLLGVRIPRHQGPGMVVYTWLSLLQSVGQANMCDMVTSAMCLGVLIAAKELSDRYRHYLKVPVPTELLVIVVATLVSHFGQLHTRFGSSVAGNIPTGFVAPQVPDPKIMWHVALDAISLALVGSAFSISLAEMFARSHGYSVHANQELLAVGCCNVLPAFFHCFATSAALSKTLVKTATGCQTQLSSVLAQTGSDPPPRHLCTTSSDQQFPGHPPQHHPPGCNEIQQPVYPDLLDATVRYGTYVGKVQLLVPTKVVLFIVERSQGWNSRQELKQRLWWKALTGLIPMATCPEFTNHICNFMSHEKCLKQVKTPCTSIAPSLVRVPVAHCFGSLGLYKRKFCVVCRKSLEVPALRCEVCELHVHPDCVPFACSDCRQCHQDGQQDYDTYHHHWREGNLPSGARCEVCRKTCGSSDVLAGVRCEWCGVQAHSVCSTALPPECTFGRLRSMVLPPSCVRLLSRNFSKMHCFRIPETIALELGDGDDGLDGSAATGLGREVLTATESTKQTLKIFDGNDSMRKNQFRLVTVSRLARNEEVMEAALRAYYINEDPRDFQLQALPLTILSGNAQALGKAGTMEEEASKGSGPRDSMPEAWVIRSLPRAQEILKIYPGWLKVGVAYVSIRVNSQSTAQSVVQEVLPLLGRQVEDQERFQLIEVLMSSRQVQRTVLIDEELLLDRLWDIRQHTKLPPDCCPLLVFVNPKSGGLKGRELLCSFRKLLNPHQVFELTNGGPLPGFHLFSQVPCFRVLVCGGDGTVGWVLAALEETRRHLACPEPSVAILPLGTGNDLGRVLRWGAGYSGEDPFSVLVSVDEADAVLMDRWTILLDAHETDSMENSVVDTEPPKIVQMNNYCGIGIDAELSLDFHQAREEEPGKFTSRFHNKGVYVRVGLQKISHSRSLHKEIRLQVHMLRKAKQKPRKAVNIRDTRVDTLPVPESSP
ncbi:diacylglycerol kinase theta [Cricetulus griseus]|nr:diacylglycerol kinase theta [Cricetulus griseus]